MDRRELLKLAAGIGGVTAAPGLVAGPSMGAQTPPSQNTRIPESSFDIRGNTLHWAGSPIRLLGVAIGDPIYIRKGRPVSDYTTVRRDWSSNTVRICIHPGHWANEREPAFAALYKDVTSARQAGLFVIIDWKAIGFPDRYVEKPDPAWGLPENAYASDYALAAGFWERMADTFGSDPGILFELWNEPTVDPKLWVSTGEHWPLLKSLWMKLLEVVRRKSSNIVLVAGGQWAHDLKSVAGNLIDDPRVAYAWHCYPPSNRDIPAGWLDSLDDLPSVKPVVVTEWGFCRICEKHIRGTVEGFGKPFAAQILEALRLSSTAWCWSPGAAPQMLLWDWKTPTEFGGFVKAHLESAYQPYRKPL